MLKILLPACTLALTHTPREGGNSAHVARAPLATRVMCSVCVCACLTTRVIDRMLIARSLVSADCRCLGPGVATPRAGCRAATLNAF